VVFLHQSRSVLNGGADRHSACSVVRVMTPHPDFAPSDMSIQAALRKMHGQSFRLVKMPVIEPWSWTSRAVVWFSFIRAAASLTVVRTYSSSRKLYDALEGVQTELGSSQPQQVIQYVEALRLRDELYARSNFSIAS
jgi:hypothetical protein